MRSAVNIPVLRKKKQLASLGAPGQMKIHFLFEPAPLGTGERFDFDYTK